MATEIERKFLIKNDQWREGAGNGVPYRQGYMTEKGPASVRIRIEGDQANINIKSATLDMVRKEYEYSIPLADAEEMLEQMCLKPLIEKTRYHVHFGDHLWEVDVFEGENAGLIVAEIELRDKDESFEKPEWLGKEVTEDQRYYNVCLVKHPYHLWKESAGD